jgi:hypothetical protein
LDPVGIAAQRVTCPLAQLLGERAPQGQAGSRIPVSPLAVLAVLLMAKRPAAQAVDAGLVHPAPRPVWSRTAQAALWEPFCRQAKQRLAQLRVVQPPVWPAARQLLRAALKRAAHRPVLRQERVGLVKLAQSPVSRLAQR